MGSHIVVRTSTTSLLQSARAVGSRCGRITWLQPMAPGIQSASSARWASYLRPHTQLWLAYEPENKWEKMHVCFICNILTSTLMKTICPMNTLLLEIMQINQGSVGIFYILFKSISVCSIWSKMVQCAALLCLTCASVKHKMPSVERDKQEQL